MMKKKIGGNPEIVLSSEFRVLSSEFKGLSLKFTSFAEASEAGGSLELQGLLFEKRNDLPGFPAGRFLI